MPRVHLFDARRFMEAKIPFRSFSRFALFFPSVEGSLIFLFHTHLVKFFPTINVGFFGLSVLTRF